MRLLPSLLLLAACGTSTGETDVATDDLVPLAPPPPGEGFQMSMETDAPGLTEVWRCKVYDISTNSLSNVNRVEYQQNLGTHHMTISTLALAGKRLEPGDYDCNDLYADPELMANSTNLFGGQGDAEGVVQLPEGVVAQIPAGLQVLHELHYVNFTADPVRLYSRVNAYTIPEDQVVSGIWGGQARDEHIEIPTGEGHTEWTRCVFNEDVDVLFLASHTHKHATRYDVRPFDGTATGEVIYTNDDWHNPKLTQFDPPLHINAGSGFEFTCTYRNDTDAPIRYGMTAEDEMCNLAYVHTPASMTAKCEIVDSSNGTAAPE
jgi:hypothetical protein